jgi:hypothetical protein
MTMPVLLWGPLETIEKLMWEMVEHANHSPDLMTSDFHLFEQLKDATGWRKFQCDDDVKNMIHQ